MRQGLFFAIFVGNFQSMLKAKFFKGWMKSEKMAHPEWIEKWRMLSEQTAAENRELVVFSVPLKPGQSSSEAIAEIEKHLQIIYPDL